MSDSAPSSSIQAQGRVPESPGSASAAQRLKVCIVSRAPFVGGAELAAERLGVGLTQAGHDVLMVLGVNGEVMERMQRAGLRCVHLATPLADRKRFWVYLIARARLRGLFRREKPDVIHSNDLPTHQIVSDAARPLVVPVICHHRFTYPGEGIDWFNRHGAARHVFVSRGLMDPLCEASKRLAASPRSVVYDGLELPPLPNGDDRAAARRELGLPADKVIVLYAGQIIERKGVADLMHAWSRGESDPARAAFLVVVGDDSAGNGAYRRAMEKLAGDLSLGEDRLRFVGFQKNVPRWLAAADIAVVPSHVEPLGNATLEAMAFALPVIGGNVGGIPEMVVEGQTGLLVPPRDPPALAAALGRLIGDATLRRKMGVAGRERCETMFSLAAHTRAVLGEYDAVLTGSRGRGGHGDRP
ncbi:MAG: glycosyltransferase family 4 protein [Planctomycetes bacterium]|nr:glycosyltransferase family 4 protein [Planctomycetota bacterium]